MKLGLRGERLSKRLLSTEELHVRKIARDRVYEATHREERKAKCRAYYQAKLKARRNGSLGRNKYPEGESWL